MRTRLAVLSGFWLVLGLQIELALTNDIRANLYNLSGIEHLCCLFVWTALSFSWITALISVGHFLVYGDQ